jgi:hypothetical protein
MRHAMTKLLVSTLLLAAFAYTLFIIWIVWFTLAFFDVDAKAGQVSGMIVLGFVALSPIPLGIYCFRRAKALLHDDKPKI